MALSAFPTGGKSGALLTETPAKSRDRTGPRASLQHSCCCSQVLILGLQGCTPEGERKDVDETLHGKSWFHIKLKSKLFL